MFKYYFRRLTVNAAGKDLKCNIELDLFSIKTKLRVSQDSDPISFNFFTSCFQFLKIY